jgi:hypothetical protein
MYKRCWLILLCSKRVTGKDHETERCKKKVSAIGPSFEPVTNVTKMLHSLVLNMNMVRVSPMVKL